MPKCLILDLFFSKNNLFKQQNKLKLNQIDWNMFSSLNPHISQPFLLRSFVRQSFWAAPCWLWSWQTCHDLWYQHSTVSTWKSILVYLVNDEMNKIKIDILLLVLFFSILPLSIWTLPLAFWVLPPGLWGWPSRPSLSTRLLAAFF